MGFSSKSFNSIINIDNCRSINGSKSKIVCEAISVQPQTAIEGLNIAEDVAHVGFSGFHFSNLKCGSIYLSFSILFVFVLAFF